MITISMILAFGLLLRRLYGPPGWGRLRVLLPFMLIALLCNAQAPKPVIDWKYIALSGANVGMTAGDIAATRHCIDNGTCREGNPLLGQSLGQQLIVSGGLTVGEIWIAHKLRKAHSNLWWVPLAAGVGWHGAGIGITLAR